MKWVTATYMRPLYMHIFLRQTREGRPSYLSLQQQLPQLFLPCLPTHNEAACCAQNNVRLRRSENASVLCVYAKVYTNCGYDPPE